MNYCFSLSVLSFENKKCVSQRKNRFSLLICWSHLVENAVRRIECLEFDHTWVVGDVSSAREMFTGIDTAIVNDLL